MLEQRGSFPAILVTAGERDMYFFVFLRVSALDLLGVLGGLGGSILF
jgi:hypothetical protein